MKKKICVALCFVTGFFLFSQLPAAEHAGKGHGSKEHGGKEHGGVSAVSKEKAKEMAQPSKDDIHNAIRQYITAESGESGLLKVYDSEASKTRNLELLNIHDRVGKTGDYYYSCADFKDRDSGQTVDLDLDVASEDGKLSVKEVRIHKVDGKERYTYDEQDNRIPVNQ